MSKVQRLKIRKLPVKSLHALDLLTSTAAFLVFDAAFSKWALLTANCLVCSFYEFYTKIRSSGMIGDAAKSINFKVL